MLTYTTPSGTGTVENQWSELSPSQFVETVALTNRFFTAEFDITEYRIRLLEALTGYKRGKVARGQKPEARGQQQEAINQNLYLISEQLTFAIIPKHGPAEVLEFFSPELRELLKTRFTWEIYDPEMVQQLNLMGNRLQTTFEINFNLGRNPLPRIRINDTILQGPVFDTTDGDIDTTLRAGEFLDAQEYYIAYTDTNNPKYLDLMIMALYKPGGADSDPRVDSIPDFTNPATKQAIKMVFIFIQQTLVADPVYRVLFARGENRHPATGKIQIGPDEAIAQLVEAGYGTHESILNLDVRTFLNYQVIMLKKSIQTLLSYNKKPGEIARTLNIPIETILKL